ncbi:MAG: hypothetical protein H0T89_12075 [Deltaproteobacteria bacterium]|nr:hypothetical protein [Deltaproteobacteria bacterium]MDQ3300225.1 hypothetical protein [Myxococcota bacterium]
MYRILAVVAMLAACGSPGGGGGGGGDDTPDPATVFDPSVTRVVIEIDFEDGQEPFTGPILGFGDTMDVTVTNIDRVFAGKKQLTIPRVVGAMENIGAVADEELTSADLLALSNAHRDLRDGTGGKSYYVLFVGGHFADGGGVRPTVLGVSLGGTGVIAMFKDVIRTTSVPAFPNVVRFVEQSTLVHELGHAIGLVGNGVEPTVDHKDTEHGAHCTNDACVMYYLNEGASDAAAFAQKYVLAGNTILFDGACLGDVDALTGGP